VTASLVLNRRASPDAGLCLRCGTTQVWPAQHVALVGNQRVALTKGESAMLLTMVAAGGAPVPRPMLAAVWGRPTRRAVGRSVDTRVSALRKKLGDDARAPRLIVTVSGVGYAIRVDLTAEGLGIDRPSTGMREGTTREGQSRYARVSRRSRTGAA